MIRYSALLEKDYRLYYSVLHSDIYQVLAIDRNLRIFDDTITFFVFCASLGLKYQRKESIEPKNPIGIRLQTIKESQLSTIYGAIFEADLLQAGVENLADPAYVGKILKWVEQYAEGGVTILKEKVFKQRFDGKFLRADYRLYLNDLSRFIGEELLDAEIVRKMHMTTISKVSLSLSTTAKRIIRNHPFSLTFNQDIRVTEDNLPLRAKVFFVDEHGEPLSDIQVLNVNGRNESTMKYSIDFHFKNRNSPLNCTLIIDDDETHLNIKRYDFKVELSFSSSLL